jgi:cytochrome P450
MPSDPHQLTFDDLAIDPYPWFDDLRSFGGGVWAPNLSMWLVTGYDDVVTVLRHPQLTNDSPDSLIQSTFGRQMLSVEGEEQKRYKQACLAPFTGKAARDLWQPQVTQLCQRLLDRIGADSARAGGPIDLMTAYAAPIALETMGIVIGLPSQDLRRIRSWYEVFARSLANFEGDEQVHRDGQQAAAAMRSYLGEQIDRRARHRSPEPAATLIDGLAASSTPLDRGEILSNLLIVLFGGIETTESMIGNALWYLLTEPGQLQTTLEGLAAVDEPPLENQQFLERIEALMEESLRYEPAVQTLTRHATVDMELLGQQIRRGATVQCMVGGANRDPEVFEQPHRFHVERRNNRKHLAFGLGSHFCLGAQLARAETRAAIAVLLAGFPELALQPQGSLPPYGHEFRKPGRVLVELRPESRKAGP